MSQRSRYLKSFICACILVTSPMHAQIKEFSKPKLILVLVIDQFRADQVARFESRFLPAKSKDGKVGGIRYLMEQGAYFPFAEYGNLQNMTGPGHATILTGAYAYQHGISTNEWTNGETGELEYCVADKSSPQIGGVASSPRSAGISPVNLQASTLGDELKNSGYPSRVFSLALKDRAAVLLGGHRADLALWFNNESVSWASSRFYLPDGSLPPWLQTWNSELARRAEEELNWEKPVGIGSGTSLEKNEDILMKRGPDALQANFPHKVKVNSPYAASLPFGTKITVDLALKIFEEYKLGSGPAPDILAVSLSNHDFISHGYGPNSREVEEMTVVEDAQIARLLQKIDATVGLSQSLIVLTADHGAPPQPEWLKKNRVPAGRIDEIALKNQGESHLQQKFGKTKSGPWIYNVSELNFYINRRAVREAKLEMGVVQEALAQFYRQEQSLKESIAHIFTGTDVIKRQLPPGLHEKQILQTYRSGRNGDVMMIPRPFYMIPYGTVTHMTGYTYDRVVPLFFAGKGIQAGRYGQAAEVIDIAPTLAFLTGTTPPSGSQGRVLYEIFKEKFSK